MDKLIELLIKYAEKNGHEPEEIFILINTDGTGVVETWAETVFSFADEDSLKEQLME